MHVQSTTLAERQALLASIQPAGRPRPAIAGYGCLSYARQSKSVQASIDAQLRCNLRTAERLGEAVRHELTDVESGLKQDRAGYRELLRLAETGQYRYVLLYKADRLSRDDVEFVTVCRKLLHMGMHIEDYTIGPITHDNVGVLALLAHMELRSISERTKMRLEDLAASGTKLGRAPFGYKHGAQPGSWIPDPDRAPIVQELFRRADQGESLGSLRRWFNCVTGRKTKNQHIVALLRHEFYMGLSVSCKTTRSKLEQGKLYARPSDAWKITRHEYPLVDEATWRRVQERLDAHRHVGQMREQQSRYALTGIIWCGACNRRMQGITKERNTKQYVCRVCSLGRGLKKTEAAVLRLLSGLSVPVEQLAGAAGHALDVERTRLQATLSALDQELGDLTHERTELARLLARGRLTEADYSAAVRASDLERDRLDGQRREIAQQLERVPTNSWASERIRCRLAELRSWTDVATLQNVEEQQELYRLCCKAVRWMPDRQTLQVEWAPEIARYMPGPVQEVQP